MFLFQNKLRKVSCFFLARLPCPTHDWCHAQRATAGTRGIRRCTRGECRASAQGFGSGDDRARLSGKFSLATVFPELVSEARCPPCRVASRVSTVEMACRPVVVSALCVPEATKISLSQRHTYLPMIWSADYTIEGFALQVLPAGCIRCILLYYLLPRGGVVRVILQGFGFWELVIGLIDALDKKNCLAILRAELCALTAH